MDRETFLLLLLPLLLFTLRWPKAAAAEQQKCPLEFTVLQSFAGVEKDAKQANQTALCNGAKNALHLVLSVYLRKSGRFLPPPASASACWTAFNAQVRWRSGDIRSICGFQTEWIADASGCLNIRTRRQFEDHIPEKDRSELARYCNQSLTSSPCAQCTSQLTSTQAVDLQNKSQSSSASAGAASLIECGAYSNIYAAAVLNRYGPLNADTAWCLFFVEAGGSGDGGLPAWAYGVLATAVVLLGLGGALGFLYVRRRLHRRKRRVQLENFNKSFAASEPSSMNPNSTVLRFGVDEIRDATNNFSRDNILGSGAYGNVFKGVLADGSAVAVKRFKNFSAAGESGFVHEVEVIASIRHRNLVALKGFCVSAGGIQGHQRILVCEYMPNGSLHDHLFDNGNSPCSVSRRCILDWPARCRIALGMARGLAYLHNEVQPAIIHRDIKASNILLDHLFNAKVADFGLARFAPEGVSHVTTRVAGTLGYLAPEYALYGQLTDKSDVYSFGVVLLELLSGRKALAGAASPSQRGLGLGLGLATPPQAQLHITDWAWDLVRRRRALEVVETGVRGTGPPESMERLVLLALLCAHPQLQCRPGMEQVLNILECVDVPVPHVPDRPIPIITDLADIHRSFNSSDDGDSGCGSAKQLSSPTGYQSYGTQGSLHASSSSTATTPTSAAAAL